MAPRDAAVVALIGVTMVIAALVWLFGPWGLLGCGVAITALAAFGIDVTEGTAASGESVAHPSAR